MIAVAGEANRKIFFNDRNLDIEGFQIFLGGAPNLQEINVSMDDESQVGTTFAKRVLDLLHRDRVIEGASASLLMFSLSKT